MSLTSVVAAGPLMGPVLGPIAGGYLGENAGWRWVFWTITIAVRPITPYARPTVDRF